VEVPLKPMKKGVLPTRPDPNRPLPLEKGSDVILQQCSARLYGQTEAKRGGTRPAAKLNPDPRTPHKPKQKVQVVCR
jgi:hypothetical protein